MWVLPWWFHFTLDTVFLNSTFLIGFTSSQASWGAFFLLQSVFASEPPWEDAYLYLGLP